MAEVLDGFVGVEGAEDGGQSEGTETLSAHSLKRFIINLAEACDIIY